MSASRRTSRWTRRGCGALLALLAMTAASARAHDRSVSQSAVSVVGQRVRVTVRSRTVDLSALTPALAVWAHDAATERGPGAAPREPLPDALVAALHAHFRVFDVADRACTPGAPLRASSPAAELRVQITYECAGAPARYDVTPWPVPGHHHMAHIEGTSRSLLIVGGDGTLPLARSDAATATDDGDLGAALLAYLGYGATHAATGWDHVLFVLLLLAFTRRPRDAAVLVTGFTLGHALTLALAALAVLESRGPAVEALIAASVVLIAAENVAHGEPTRTGRLVAPGLVALGALGLGAASGERALVYFGVFAGCSAGLLGAPRRPEPTGAGLATDREARVRLGLAVTFGLVHGLGFASGFDAAGPFRVPRLLAFNVGVELAQLGLVALAWPLLSRLGDRDGPRRQLAVRGFSVLAGAVATYACVGRALGLAP